MKTTRHFLLTLLAVPLLFAAGGCDRYQVTLNERVISEPAPLLASVDVADEALKSCIAQTARDRKIRTTEQLRTLVCTHGGIASLEGIQILSSIETLNLADNALTSISPLLFLGKLKSVNLEGNDNLQCDDIEALREHLPEGATLLVPEHC